MKKIFNLFVVLLTMNVMWGCKRAPDSVDATTTAAKEETRQEGGTSYKVDTEASKVEWIGTKVSGYHSGTVKIRSGELMVSDGTLSGGNFVLNMQSIVATGPAKVKAEMNKKLTGHLNSPDFFDTQKFPEATFVIISVKPFSGTVKDADDLKGDELNAYKVADPSHTVSGNLTVKGITKNIEFPAKITIDDNSVEARAKFNIDRKQWGIVYPGQPDDLVRDEIYLGILLKARK
jgi:polyisoprenoid-binding protein YceI